MALTSNTQNKKIYLSIINGKFAQKVEKGTHGAVERKNKKEVLVYELLHDRVSGGIKEMKIEKNDFGEQLIIIMNEVGETYVITIPVESKYFDSFCAKMGNADLSSSLEIAPYSFEPKDAKGKRTGLNIYQGGNKLDYFFTKENPQGRPQPSAENLSEKEWKIYKIQERDFYCKYIMGMDKIPATQTGAAPSVSSNDDSSLPF